jgi:N-acetylglucosaminyldiphosphoundecaprenol N-acetyl-beta-D-mannosaminyltransferase
MASASTPKTPFLLLDLPIVPFTYPEVLHELESSILQNRKTFCVTLNLDMLRLSQQHADFASIIKEADLVFADGMPLVWLSRFSKTPLPERVAGCDVGYDLCRLSHEKGYKVFFLGAAEGVAEKAKANLLKRYPKLQVVGTHSPSRETLENEAASFNLIEQINATGAHIVLVALGAPKQERWIARHREPLNANVILPCGGTLDFMAGVQSKAPSFLGRFGLEWLYRLLSNPSRLFERYILHDLPFLAALVSHLVLRGVNHSLKQASSGKGLISLKRRHS